VTVVKPVQTGLALRDESDADVVRRLSGIEQSVELVRYAAALAPASAARAEGVVATPVAEMVARVEGMRPCDLLLVEGAGGLLVPVDGRMTWADVAEQRRGRPSKMAAMVNGMMGR